VLDASISGSLKSPAVNHSEPIHLRPTTTLAERVLLPGDPGRALALAQFLLSDPLMFNHNRGLWGYTGAAADGQPLTIQSTGMGGPSAAIVLHELISLGVTRAIRVGTCGALDPALGLGDLVVAHEAIAADGTSAALGAGQCAKADPTLAGALLAGLEREDDGRPHHHGRIVSTDLFYESDDQRMHAWSEQGALAVEMEAATLFAVGARAGVPTACLLIVTDTFDEQGTRTRIDDLALGQAVEAMGAAAAAALAL
jgi:DeoD family purine-nucleoside phosphorylase